MPNHSQPVHVNVGGRGKGRLVKVPQTLTSTASKHHARSMRKIRPRIVLVRGSDWILGVELLQLEQIEQPSLLHCGVIVSSLGISLPGGGLEGGRCVGSAVFDGRRIAGRAILARHEAHLADRQPRITTGPERASSEREHHAGCT